MNYLAHIYLADNDDESRLGNFLGDFVNKSLEKNYGDTIKEGIYMHRKLDVFTDSHPIFGESKQRISSQNRFFAAVLIDMFYDHFLAKNWSEYSSIPLEKYADGFYSLLKRYSYCLPEKLTRRMPFMIEENWLLSYRGTEGIKTAIDRIAWRFASTKHPLFNPIDELINNYEGLERDFRRFFPSIIEYANMLKRTKLLGCYKTVNKDELKAEINREH